MLGNPFCHCSKYLYFKGVAAVLQLGRYGACNGDIAWGTVLAGFASEAQCYPQSTTKWDMDGLNSELYGFCWEVTQQTAIWQFAEIKSKHLSFVVTHFCFNWNVFVEQKHCSKRVEYKVMKKQQALKLRLQNNFHWTSSISFHILITFWNIDFWSWNAPSLVFV